MLGFVHFQLSHYPCRKLHMLHCYRSQTTKQRIEEFLLSFLQLRIFNELYVSAELVPELSDRPRRFKQRYMSEKLHKDFQYLKDGGLSCSFSEELHMSSTQFCKYGSKLFQNCDILIYDGLFAHRGQSKHICKQQLSQLGMCFSIFRHFN